MPEKNCTKCGKLKPLIDFGKDSSAKSGINVYCKKCANKAKREYRLTKNGLLTTIRSNQIASSIRRKHQKPNYTLEEFRNWALKQLIFHKLYEEWKSSGYKKHLYPSSDRIDDYKPYTFNNMKWITWFENNKKGRIDKINGKNRKALKAVLQLDLNGVIIGEYYSCAKAARETGFAIQNIHYCAQGKSKTCGGYTWRFL